MNGNKFDPSLVRQADPGDEKLGGRLCYVCFVDGSWKQTAYRNTIDELRDAYEIAVEIRKRSAHRLPEDYWPNAGHPDSPYRK